jgi:hypothetical protein
MACAGLRTGVRARTFSGMLSGGLDTLEVAKRLKGAGFDDAQAETLTGVFRETREADLTRLATKEDLNALEARLTVRFGGMIVIATGILLAAKFFG